MRAFLLLSTILCLLSPSAVQGVTVFSEKKLLGHLSSGDQDQAEAEAITKGDFLGGSFGPLEV